MTPAPTAAEVVERITPTMKQWLLSPMYSCLSAGISAAWFHDTNWWAGKKAAKMGLVDRRRIETGWFASVPTKLGLEVRAALKGRQP